VDADARSLLHASIISGPPSTVSGVRRGALALIPLLVALAAAPAGAGAVTFGADLSRQPDNTATCITIQFFPIYGPNCSVVSNNPTTGENSFPPVGEGIVSRVRVRVGPATGRMQVAVEEALRKDNPGDPGHPTYACCKLVALSQVFTPAPNSVTTVPVNFPVRQDLAPDPATGFYVDDHLSLSVLDEGVPIPAASDPGAGVGIWFPAWQSPGEERAGIYGTAGLTVLFNAEWESKPGAAPGGGAAATGAALRLPRTARIVNGRAVLPLVCNLSQVCRGLLRLQNRAVGATRPLLAAAQRRRARHKRTVTYASVPFRIPAGKKRVLRAKLNAVGRRLLRRRGKARAWLNVSFRGTAATVPSRKVTLKRAARRRR
jgi:hypothetical protein